MMHRILIVAAMLVGCEDAAPTSGGAGSSAPAAVEHDDVREQCLRATEAPSNPVDVAKACAAYCESKQPDRQRAATCNVVRVAMRQECAANVASCERICLQGRSPGFVLGIACEQTAEVATAPAATFRYGDKVSAQWTNGKWYPGTLTAVYSDGTADVRYDDGDRSKGLPFAKIKLVKRPMFEVEASKAPAKLVEGASCAGPGWQYVCGGRCTDVKSDSNHCGACGNRCGDGYRCDGSGTCRDAAGRL